MSNSQPIQIKLLIYRAVSKPSDLGVTLAVWQIRYLEIYPSELGKLGFSIWFPGRPVGGQLCPAEAQLDHGQKIFLTEIQKTFELPVFRGSLPQWIATFEMEAERTVFIPINAEIPQPQSIVRFNKLLPEAYDENTQRIRNKSRSQYHIVHAGQFALKPPPTRVNNPEMRLSA